MGSNGPGARNRAIGHRPRHYIWYNFGVATNPDQFVVDHNGNRTAVLVEIERYSELLEAEEEPEAIRAYDEAKASTDHVVPLAQAIAEIESK